MTAYLHHSFLVRNYSPEWLTMPSVAAACSVRNPHFAHITPTVGRTGPPTVTSSTSWVSELVMYVSRTFQLLSPQRGQGSVTPRSASALAMFSLCSGGNAILCPSFFSRVPKFWSWRHQVCTSRRSVVRYTRAEERRIGTIRSPERLVLRCRQRLAHSGV